MKLWKEKECCTLWRWWRIGAGKGSQQLCVLFLLRVELSLLDMRDQSEMNFKELAVIYLENGGAKRDI